MSVKLRRLLPSAWRTSIPGPDLFGTRNQPQSRRIWGLVALYIAPNPLVTPPYLPFLDPIGGGYAGFVRRKEGDWTPKVTRLQHFTVDRRQRIRESLPGAHMSSGDSSPSANVT